MEYIAATYHREVVPRERTKDVQIARLRAGSEAINKRFYNISQTSRAIHLSCALREARRRRLFGQLVDRTSRYLIFASRTCTSRTRECNLVPREYLSIKNLRRASKTDTFIWRDNARARARAAPDVCARVCMPNVIYLAFQSSWHITGINIRVHCIHYIRVG